MSFGIARSIRGEVRACTPDLFNEALDSSIVARVCAEIEDNLEAYRSGKLSKEEHDELKAKLKKRLPIFTFHATFPGGRRKNDDAVPSGLSIYDLDHIANPRAKWDEIEPRKEELGIVLAHVSPSTEGLRLVFVIPQGMTLPEAQAWMAQRLGDKEYDTSVKDYARCSFAVPRGYVLWISPSLFRSSEVQESGSSDNSFSEEIKGDKGRYRSALGEIKADSFSGVQEFRSDASLRSSDNSFDYEKQKESASSASSASEKLADGHGGGSDSCFKGIPYENIVQALAEQLGGVPEHGARNNFIFSMACHLRYVCNDDAEWIARILPTYGEEREKWMNTIRSAVNRPQSRTMPQLVKRALDVAAKHSNLPSIEGGDGGGSSAPQMPSNLPPLIELLTRHVPAHARAAVAHAVFPALGAHLGGVKFRYVDNVEHEATFMCVLLAKMSSGKSAVNKPIEYILADIVERDAENRRREQEWKNSLNTKGANKEKPKRPDDLCIQVLVSDMTNAAFVQRLADAGEKFLYTQMDEIELLDQLKTSSRGNQVSQLIRLAFDQGLYGQERVGSQSVTARVKVKWNWNASSTIQKGKWYFRGALTDGTLSRLNFCTMEPTKAGEIPVYGTYDETFAKELRPYIDRLNEATGHVGCPEAEELARKLLEENAEHTVLTDDEAYEMLSYRANVIAYLKAMTLYIAHGEWTPEIEEFVRWSEEYDLWCKMHFFGDQLKEEMSRENLIVSRGPKNMLEMLPTRFSREEVMNVRRAQGKSENPTLMLNNWKKRGYIELDETTGEYIKLKRSNLGKVVSIVR